MNPIHLKQCDGNVLQLNPANDVELDRLLHLPQAQVKEMVRQISAANYYAGLFPAKGELTFLDLGANLGLVSLHALPCCRRIIAVECEPNTFSTLSKVTAPYPKIECVQVALASKFETVRLSVDCMDYSCHTIINPKPGNQFVEVQGMTFADILKLIDLRKVDVCKVDVEGAEMESLTADVIKSAPVKVWYIEVHKTPTMPRDRSLSEMIARLSKSGFQCATPRANAIVAKRP